MERVSTRKAKRGGFGTFVLFERAVLSEKGDADRGQLPGRTVDRDLRDHLTAVFQDTGGWSSAQGHQMRTGRIPCPVAEVNETIKVGYVRHVSRCTISVLDQASRISISSSGHAHYWIAPRSVAILQGLGFPKPGPEHYRQA